MRFALLALMAALVACVSTSEVSSVGQNAYLITARASGGLNAGKETTQATQRASVYCAQSGKVSVVDKIETHGNAAVFGENVGVYFHCEATK